ncbi:MAG: class I SAM-dependent methyltransferase [Woeseiaceae bacterium]
MSQMNRRHCLAALGALLTTPLVGQVFADDTGRPGTDVGNFRYIYSNPELRSQFLNFLTNVFHLYPEDEFHEVLINLCKPGVSDIEIYTSLQQQLADIRPFLGALRYAIPALKKQKAIMADQTLMLLDPDARYDGHLEIGSTGRYISILEDRLDISGDIFLLHTREAGYGPEDIVERGQIVKIGTHIDMGNYSSSFADIIPKNSLDLVTVYIGFHHCPLDKRKEFISSVRSVIRPGGTLILRDHDVRNEDLWRMAALAHDTFNAGIDETWQFNQEELRNFYSMKFITNYLEDLGFRHGGHIYFQQGDPTRNGLTAFTRV